MVGSRLTSSQTADQNLRFFSRKLLLKQMHATLPNVSAAFAPTHTHGNAYLSAQGFGIQH